MRALHVFRDQTSLAASPELWPAIEGALRESTHLLLLASPAAAGSRWVAREIEWWLVNRSASTMFVLLTEGELAWDETAGDFDWSCTTCLPREVLTGRLRGEPLWVDLRWTRTQPRDALSLRNARFRSAVLDVAAPLHGKDKDALDGEDVRAFARLQRVRRGAIAGLSTLTFLAVGLAYVAGVQRDEAVKQNTFAQAGRLAAQADLLRERGGAVDASVLLATHALTKLESVGERSLEADLSLRRALTGLPTDSTELEVTADALRLSPAGDIMIAQSTGGQLRAFDIKSGARRSCDWAELNAMSARSTAIRLITAVSSNGAWCILQQFDPGHRQRLGLWSATPLALVDTFTLVSKAGQLVPGISDDGDILVATDRVQTGAVAQFALRIWSRARRAELLRIDGEEFRGFSPDHRHFATTHGLWLLPERGSTKAVRVIEWKGEPWNLAFSRSGAYVVTRESSDGNAELWDANAHRRVRTFTPPVGSILALRDDARFIAMDAGDRTLVVDTENGDTHASVPITAVAAAFGANDPILLVQKFDRVNALHVHVIKMWLAGAALAATQVPPGMRLHRLTISGDRLGALGTTDSTLRVMHWRSNSGDWTTSLTVRATGALDISRDGTQFAAVTGDSVIVGRVDGGGRTAKVPVLKRASLIALSPGARYVAATLDDGTVSVRSLSDSTHWQSNFAAEPSALMVSPDGEYVVALNIDHKTPSRAGEQHTLIRMRRSHPEERVIVDLGRHLSPLTSLCMVSDDARVVRAGGARHAFGADTGSLVVTTDDLTECTRSHVSPVRASIDGLQLMVFDTRSSHPVARLDHPSPVVESALSDDGHRAATLDEAGTIRIFALDVRSLVAQVCARKPRPLSDDEWSRYLTSATAVDACGRTRESVAPDRPPDARR